MEPWVECVGVRGLEFEPEPVLMTVALGLSAGGAEASVLARACLV